MDLEALRAAERRHAEAQLRAVFADIKQKAFADITQRMKSGAGLGAKSSSQQVVGLLPAGGIPRHESQLSEKQLMQRFSSAAPVSHMVQHLQGSTDLQRLSRSGSQLYSAAGRPPTGKARVAEHSRRSKDTSVDLQSDVGRSDLPKRPLNTIQADVSSDKLMRLTSCVKLHNAQA